MVLKKISINQYFFIRIYKDEIIRQFKYDYISNLNGVNHWFEELSHFKKLKYKNIYYILINKSIIL